MPFLLDLTGRHRVTKALRVFRFTDIPGGYNTASGDDPADVHYQPRLKVDEVGSYRRTLFGRNRTNGVAEVDRGSLGLDNTDGKLDEMMDYAFDGYPLTLWSIATKRKPYASKLVQTTATVEQIEVSWDGISLRLRSRLAHLDVPIQSLTYAGTTVDGTRTDAEGTLELKGVPRLLLYGAPRNVPALLLNRWKLVFGVGHQLSAVIRVRDKGVIINPTGQDYPDLASLMAANIQGGRYATCLALGLIRFGSGTVLQGQVTVDAVEGATSALRTAGQVVRRILIEQAGLVEGRDFLGSDIAALDALAPYEVGYWPGTTPVNTLTVVSTILDSVRGWISPDRQGVFRIGQFRAPIGNPKRTFGPIELVEDGGVGLQLLATGDENNGVPTNKVILQHTRNHAVATEDALAGDAIVNDPDFVAFAKQEYRQAEAENPATLDLHQLAKPMTFTTCLVSVAAAQAEAGERLALYGVSRRHYAGMVRSQFADVELSEEAGLKLKRFGLAAGKSFAVTGAYEDYSAGTTTYNLWG